MRLITSRWLAMAILMTAALLASGCASSFRETGHIEIQPYDERSYTKVLRAKNGRTILEIDVEYLGKAPQGELKQYNNPCWEQLDADFWDIHFSNLSNQKIILTEWIYLVAGSLSQAKDQTQRVEQKMGPEGITRLLGTYVINPGQSVMQSNSHICADPDTDTRETLKGIKLRHAGRTYQVEIRQRYLR